MSKLAPLRRQLRGMRRRRRAFRLAVSLSVLVALCVGLLLALWAVDWLLDLNRLARLFLLVLSAGVWGWAARRWMFPWLAVRESELQIALLLARQQGIDDLVPALQFDAVAPLEGESQELRLAVIDRVARLTGRVERPWLDRRPLVRWSQAAALLTLAAAGLAVVFPAQARAFGQRLLFAPVRYPTRTVIKRVSINGQWLALDDNSLVVRCALGDEVAIETHCRGELPDAGQVILRSSSGAARGEFDLLPSEPARPGEFDSQLPPISSSVALEIHAGDDRTPPIWLQVAPRPEISVILEVDPPGYAAAAGDALHPERGSRDISVLRHSRVGLRIACGNKCLRRAEVLLGEERWPLEAASELDSAGELWLLHASDRSLDDLTETRRVSILVEDEDGWTPVDPVEVTIRVRSDAPPKATLSVNTTRVLPDAAPTVSFRVTDDFGIAAVFVHLETVREGSDARDSQFVPFDLAQPVLGHPAELAGSVTLDLTPLKLAPGDKVAVACEAVDFQGPWPGQSGQSAAVMLEITDEGGVLRGLLESDEQTARELEELLRRTLEIGESP